MTGILTSLGFGRETRRTQKAAQLAAEPEDDLEARSKEAQRVLIHAANNAEQVIQALLDSRANQRRKPVA